MTQHATARPDTNGRLDDPRAVGDAVTGASRFRRRVVTGTGATLVLAVASVAAAGAAQADQQYVVRSGDTVSHIAARTGVSAAAIAKANSLANVAKIRIGQQLTIPTGASAPVAAAPAAAPAAATHTVVSGETVSVIAKHNGTSVAAIIAANGLDSRAFIRVGQQLTLPGAASSAAASAPVAVAARAAVTHQVASGETVSGIAKKYGTSVAAIVAGNGLDSRAFVRVGQQLTISGASAAAVVVSAPSAAASVKATHKVASGETVSAIAKKYGTSVAAIVAANKLDSRAFVRIGQQLAIPGAAPTVQLVGNTFAGRTYPEAVVASANLNKSTLLSLGVPTKKQMQAKVVSIARSMGVDPALVQAIAFQESGFNHAAVSPANAIGTMQVIPSSGEWASTLVGRHLNLLDPDDNVTAGAAILSSLVRGSVDLPNAIAGYYQGATSVKRNGMFADTRVYVANIQTLMARFS